MKALALILPVKQAVAVLTHLANQEHRVLYIVLLSGSQTIDCKKESPPRNSIAV